MTGILGFKAYKCLDSSIFVLLIILLFTIGVIGVSFMDFVALRGAARLSGIDNLVSLIRQANELF